MQRSKNWVDEDTDIKEYVYSLENVDLTKEVTGLKVNKMGGLAESYEDEEEKERLKAEEEARLRKEDICKCKEKFKSIFCKAKEQSIEDVRCLEGELKNLKRKYTIYKGDELQEINKEEFLEKNKKARLLLTSELVIKNENTEEA
ncbi:uncharacterized protein K444DRAFT_638514 [Hyaloscypha bicolor E]|uniref:Uncharacterized protein n=1 Tax=Hyaloscypha bicolor E TaxID=1095630 RepID=A0A2J6SGN7_9HELO|nr:uncharacterized protein K444DRAFT_638514 [Hyaloscypha bicolor E]PMD49935.1 hypothetical protein K444DRAFT_638514 [Hyaloscypha bicolor E]